MQRLMMLVRRQLFLGVACSLGLIALPVGNAGAASLLLTVSESDGGASVPIADNSSLDTNPLVGVITVNVSLLNPSLNNYNFTGLEAVSNAPGSSTVASLTQTGTAQLLAGVGTGSVTIQASDVDYNLPSGSPGNLSSSSSNTYTGATNGDSQLFKSWFNPSNTLNGTEVASPTVTLTAFSPPNPNSHSENAAKTPVILTAPYGLTNRTTITLTGGSILAPAQDQFTGSTTTSAIPEPASLALMLTALPVSVLGLARKRKATA